MRKYNRIAISLLAVLLFTACSSVKSIPTPKVIIPALEKEAYPAFGQVESTAYPSPGGGVFTPVPEGALPPVPKDAPETEANTASISGVLFSHTIRQALPETSFYLTSAVGPEKRDVPPVIVGADTSRGEISGMSDSQGNVRMANIPPGNYYLVVWAPMNWSLVQNSPEDETARLIELKAGDRISLGVLYTSWP